MKRKEKVKKMLETQEKKLKATKDLYINMTPAESAMCYGTSIKQINLIKGKIKILKWILEE